MIETEKAFDMLPYVADIYDKTNLKDYIKNNYKSLSEKKGTEINQILAGVDLFKFVLKNSNKVKEEFFHIVAIAEDKEIEVVKKQSLITTVASIKNIFANKELVDFFKQAMQ